MIKKINLLIIGNGHYSTGSTVIEGKITTDKDLGVLLPSSLELRKQGTVDTIFLAGKTKSKFPLLRKKLIYLRKTFGWNTNVTLFDNYLEALEKLPRPGSVMIATPDYLHQAMIMSSLKEELHTMVVSKDLEKIITLQKKQQVLGLVDYHKAYDEANLILRDEYQGGKYGEIQHIFSKITQRRDMFRIFQRWIGRKGHNVNHYLGSHYIHLIGFITGAKPLSVRATAQYGVARKEFKINTPDLIETQIQWRTKNGKQFVSYHLAGWADPPETASMTYQQIHFVSTEGHIESDQRFRGFETNLLYEGQRIINPYFFHLNKGIRGNLDLESKYGYKSIKTFIQSSIEVENGASIQSFEKYLPTFKESRKVTAILEAADTSLANQSRIINLD